MLVVVITIANDNIREENTFYTTKKATHEKNWETQIFTQNLEQQLNFIL